MFLFYVFFKNIEVFIQISCKCISIYIGCNIECEDCEAREAISWIMGLMLLFHGL